MPLLLLPSILFASLNSILLHRVKLTTPASVFGLNAIGSLVWLLCLSALNGFSLHFSRPILIFGGGLLVCGAQYQEDGTAVMTASLLSLETGEVTDAQISSMIRERKLSSHCASPYSHIFSSVQPGSWTI